MKKLVETALSLLENVKIARRANPITGEFDEMLQSDAMINCKGRQISMLSVAKGWGVLEVIEQTMSEKDGKLDCFFAKTHFEGVTDELLGFVNSAEYQKSKTSICAAISDVYTAKLAQKTQPKSAVPTEIETEKKSKQ